MIEYVVIIVGAGGTGGNFVKEYARYISCLSKDNVAVKTVLVDGDYVEQKNMERQPFIDEDINQNKAVTLASAIEDTFSGVQINAYPHYIDNAEEIVRIFQNVRSYSGSSVNVSIPVIIGCVDNHRARQ